MIRYNNTLGLLIAALFLSLVSCKDKAEEIIDPIIKKGAAPLSKLPILGNGNGVLMSIKTHTTKDVGGTPVELTIGTAVASFPDTSGVTLDAGTVSVKDTALTKLPENIYTFQPDLSSPTGFHFKDSVKWAASGNSASNIPPFSETVANNFPDIPAIKMTGEEIDVTKDFNFQTEAAIVGADSVIFGMYGPDTALVVVLDNKHTYNFKTSELSKLGKGPGAIQVIGFNFEFSNAQVVNKFFVNETIRTKPVVFK